MIKNLIFDFGDVFINLDKSGAIQHALNLFGIESFSEELIGCNEQFEKGDISSADFIEFYQNKFPHCNHDDIVFAWNFILKDFPTHRLAFLNDLKSQGSYRLFLLSNTNEIHIDFIKNKYDFFEDFKSCFDQFYLSHEVRMRKPNREIFELVLQENRLDPKECLFIDDTKENTDSADLLGIHTWNLDQTKQDVVDLFFIKSALF
jgi:FMN phosphatase YigB (HAD superfamily)